MSLTAVIGVSSDESKFGFRIFRDLIAAGWDVCGVNPRGGTVCGRTLYPSLSAVGRIPDLVVTVVPPQVTEKIVRECAALGVKEIWMQPGSDSDAAAEAAKAAGMNVVRNACLMVKKGLW